MESVLREILCCLIVLSLLLSISWYLYYSLQDKSAMSVDTLDIDQRAETLPEISSQPDVETPIASHKEAADTPGIRHRTFKDANVTSDDDNSKEGTALLNDEEVNDNVCTRGDGNKNSNEPKDADLTLRDVNNVIECNIAQLKEETGSEYKKGNKSHWKDHKSQTTEDIESKCIPGDESIQKVSNDYVSQPIAKEGINAESGAGKCDHDNVDEGGDDDKKLDRCDEEFDGEINKGEDVCYNDDGGDYCNKYKRKDSDDVSSIGRSVGDSDYQDISEDEISILSQYYDTTSVTSAIYIL